MARQWRDVSPEERRSAVEPAAEGRRRIGTDSHIRVIVARAGKLTPAQIETLRALLPDPGDES
jgi:hypothetical protein